MKTNRRAQQLIQAIKNNYKINGRWTKQALADQQSLEQLLEGDAYLRYSQDKPTSVDSLNDHEQQAFVDYIKALAVRAGTVDIRAQGKEKVALSSQTDTDLGNAEAFRVLPKDFEQRHGTRASVGARLTVTVDNTHFNQLANALTQLFNDDNRSWLEQAKIMGPRNLGSRTDHAVIYLSEAGLEHARVIQEMLGVLLPATAFVEHTPMGMHRMGKGISYSETAKGGSSSHGQSRARLIATAGGEALLTDTPVETTLTRTLQKRGYDAQDPALLAQAVRDRELRGGFESIGDPTVFRPGSPDIQQFAADPNRFAATHAISAEAMTKLGSLPAQGYAKFVAVAPNVYEVEYTSQGSHSTLFDSVPAYFLGYNGANQGNTSPAYVDIPKHSTPGTFLFTGSLTGCSVIVTDLDANTYRVYHDGRVNSSVLYDNVVMAVDFKDYQVLGTRTGLAAAYMQYVDSQWQLAFQRQQYLREGDGRHDLRPILRSGVEPFSIQSPDNGVGARNHAYLATAHQQLQQQLRKTARQFGVSTDRVTYGTFEGGSFTYDHPAIAAWNKLRGDIQAQIEVETRELVYKKADLYDAKRIRNANQLLIDEQIKQINLTLEYYKAQYEPLLSDSATADRTWLWQQKKAREGMAAVVQIDDTSIRRGILEPSNNLAQRYAVVESYQLGRQDPAFTEGRHNFHEVAIPGLHENMPALEMKHLFLEGPLTPRQRGALSVYITEASQAEYIEMVLNHTATFAEDFRQAGSTFDRLTPQDFYLSLVGDKAGGRCYPLVRTMAVALANGGEQAVNNLVEKLFVAAADPYAGSSTLFKNSLIKLHSNVEAVQASTLLGKFNLTDIVSRLERVTTTSMFALNTQGHSMMVGVTVEHETRHYYFYDPNVGFFAFDVSGNLLSAMQQHLITRELAAYYGSFGSLSAPEFNLVEIDTAKMAEVPVGNGLNVANLTESNDLASVVERQHQAAQTVSAGERIRENVRLHAALVTLDAEQWGRRFDESSTRLAHEAGLDHNWMPVIANTEDQGEGSYRVQFINRDRPDEVRWLNTRDTTFAEFRRFVDDHLAALGEHFTMERGQLQPRNGASEAAPVDGLNAGFIVQALIQWFTQKNRDDAAHGVASPDLATALKVHSYLNFTQMAHGGLQDVAKVTELVRTALRGEVVAAETSLNSFGSSLGHTVNEGAGVLLGGAMVGLDAYELAHAENDVQKAVFGTQLAFDSASFVVGAAGVGAGLVGASTVGAVLGGAGVILGGLAVGFAGLAQAFGAVAEDAKAVGRYFDAVDTAYKANGYRYDAEKQVLVPLAGAIVKSIDLRNSQIEFDSQYIYRTHHGSTGSGYINYFFWAGDKPTMVRDRNQAIEIRSGIGYATSRQPLAHSDSATVILPGTPKSYINYEYQILPGATTRYDSGFEVIRRLEKDRRFDYDFYVFPSEYLIRRIHHEYVATAIEVILDQRSRRLVVPDLPNELRGYLSYEIKGTGGEYLIGLNEGVGVRLSSDASSTPSRWIIDCSQLASDMINVSHNRLVVGGVGVDLDPAKHGRVLVIARNSEIREVDFAAQTSKVVSEDASRWQTTGQHIEQHLRDLAQAHQLGGQYVMVENYRYKEREVGRAFYDVANDRMLFTDTTNTVAKNAELGAVIGNHVYFYHAQNAAVWRVEAGTGRFEAQFQPWFDHVAGKVSRVWQEGDAVYLARRYVLDNGSEGELCYRIHGEQMALVSATGNDALLQRLARTNRLTGDIKAMLDGYESNHLPRESLTDLQSTRVIESTSAPLVTVFGKDTDGIAHRYWIRTDTRIVIKPNLAPPADQALRVEPSTRVRSAWPIPADLVLAGSIPRPDGKEVFFFYSKEEKVLFRQEGPGQVELEATHPTAFRVSTPPLANVINLNGSLVAVTEDGRVEQINTAGQLSLEAVNEHWLKGRTTWWKDLATVTGSRSTTLAVFGIKASDRKSALPVWYHNGQVVVASAALQGKPLQFLGFEPDGSAARLFDPVSGKLYRQPPMGPTALATAFGTDEVLEPSAPIPAASEFMPELQLKAAGQVDGMMRLTTREGAILARADSGELQLIAVDEAWQQANATHLSQALIKLAAKWHATGVVALHNKETPGWFDIRSGLLFSSHDLRRFSDLYFVGVAEGLQAAYVYSGGSGHLFLVENSQVHNAGVFSHIERVGSTLLLQSHEERTAVHSAGENELILPIVTGIDTLVLSGGVGRDTYLISNAVWNHYHTVVIDNYDQGKAPDRLFMCEFDPAKLLISRRNVDLMLTESGTGQVVVIRKVFGSDAEAYQHLQVELAGTPPAVTVNHLARYFSGDTDRIGGRLLELSWISKQPVLAADELASREPDLSHLAQVTNSIDTEPRQAGNVHSPTHDATGDHNRAHSRRLRDR
ncbi:TcdA/TcdB pore-forming domain-containing protein [Chitinimonas sp. PSY-7]|uniref:TcdA/TcdB pore-forming domain-containing protein n=1 Tax=Chitinimonas sp. PSY-7 TaxID=3459088 RepID=UPI00404000CB